MHVQLLISTCNQGIQKVEAMLLPPIDGVSYLISHQCVNDYFRTVPPALIRDDVIILQMDRLGLSANRNNCLRNATGDILMILDDDVRLKPEYIGKVRDFFRSGDVDVACSKILTMPDEPEYKNYSLEQHRLNRISQLKAVSSIEIALRLQPVRDKDIWFDERFGLGASFGSGEELLFLRDCLKKGLNIRYFPEYTVEHPYQSSTKSQSPYSDERLYVTGAQAYAMYGNMAYIRNLFAVLKRFGVLKKEHVSPGNFLKVKNAGANHLRSLDSNMSSRQR